MSRVFLVASRTGGEWLQGGVLEIKMKNNNFREETVSAFSSLIFAIFSNNSSSIF